MNTLEKVLDILENDLPSIDNQFYSINSGGCGHMAAIIAEQLDRYQINYDIVCKGGWGCSKDKMTNAEVNHEIDNGNTRNLPNSHVLIMVAGRIFDSEGEQEVSESSITALIDYETMMRMLGVRGAWNSCFDKHQVSDMRDYAENVFDSAMGSEAA